MHVYNKLATSSLYIIGFEFSRQMSSLNINMFWFISLQPYKIKFCILFHCLTIVDVMQERNLRLVVNLPKISTYYLWITQNMSSNGIQTDI